MSNIAIFLKSPCGFDILWFLQKLLNYLGLDVHSFESLSLDPEYVSGWKNGLIAIQVQKYARGSLLNLLGHLVWVFKRMVLEWWPCHKQLAEA